MIADDVWLAIPNYGDSTKILAPADLLPFGDGEIVTLGTKGKGTSVKPLSAALVKRFAARYPRVKFISLSPAQPSSGSYVHLGAVEFRNRFSARCDVTQSCAVHGINNMNVEGQLYATHSFYLTRSPINFGDDEWHVTKVTNPGGSRIFF